MTPSFSLEQASQTAVARGLNPELASGIFGRQGLQTPLMILSRSEVRNNFEQIRTALPRVDIHYAVKSNNHPVIMNEVQRAGGSFDVCSAAEIEMAVRAGVPAHTLVHTHPIKTQTEFDRAVEAGVEIFVVDNVEEIGKFERYPGRRLKVMIRYRIETEHRAVVDLQYKFGCLPTEVVSLARKIEEAGHEYWGLCFHVGSQCIYADNYVSAIETAGELISTLSELGLRTRTLDIGGGFPVQYVEPIPSVEELCRPINRALAENIGPEVRTICEPGRSISASPITLVCRVVGKANRDDRTWYYLDDGLYSTFSGMLFDHCQYPVVTNASGQGKPSVLAGPTCDSFDVMYDGMLIPEHNLGDMMLFPLTGAYCAVSASDFNSMKRPDYLIVD